MFKRFKAVLCLGVFLLATLVSTALANHDYTELRRQAGHLVFQTERLYQDTYSLSDSASLEAFLLWGAAQNFQQTIDRAIARNFFAVERAFRLVEIQRQRMDATLGHRPDIAQTVAMIRTLLIPPIKAPMVSISQCKLSGNPYKGEDLLIVGTVRGRDIQRITAYYGSLEYDLSWWAANFYSQNPGLRNQEATIPFMPKFKRAAGSERAAICGVRAYDQGNREGYTETAVTGR